MNLHPPLEVISLFAPEDQVSTNGQPIRGKFVLVQSADSLVLTLGPLTRYAYHADLLAAFCESRQIVAVWERRPDTLKIKAPEISILGGGHLAWNPSGREARFGGSSKAYGPINLAGLPELLAGVEFFAGYKIIVE